MLRARRKSLTLTLLLATTLLAGGAEAADATKDAPPKLSGLEARVAHGSRVSLAASSFTPAELAALRPHYENLKPRVRGNTD